MELDQVRRRAAAGAGALLGRHRSHGRLHSVGHGAESVQCRPARPPAGPGRRHEGPAFHDGPDHGEPPVRTRFPLPLLNGNGNDWNSQQWKNLGVRSFVFWNSSSSVIFRCNSSMSASASWNLRAERVLKPTALMFSEL